MNSNIDAYLQSVSSEIELALNKGETSISKILPCFIFRELEVPNNRFVVSTTRPFISSYKSLLRNQNLKPIIPRKIEYESAIYLKEGVIDSIFSTNSLVTLLFVGDGASDMRFSYNSYRFFRTFGKNLKVRAFICNSDSIGRKFGDQTIKSGWNNSEFGDKLFYNSDTWSDLENFLFEVTSEDAENHRYISIIDIDGTLLCPRPKYNGLIKQVRIQALKLFCEKHFDDEFFNIKIEEHTSKLEESYAAASNTGFCKSYDDEDLTMLVALGLYAEIISEDDFLLNPTNNIGFVVPTEWLQYASSQLENSPHPKYKLSRLHGLYDQCAKALYNGSPTAFVDFREVENLVLTDWAKDKKIVLNKAVISFINEAVKKQIVPIAYSDRPNASVGLITTGTYNNTVESKENAFIDSLVKLV